MAHASDSPARRPRRDTAAPAAPLPTLAPALEPAPEPAHALALQPAPEPPLPTPQLPATTDAHGFDPAEYKWLPVRRRPRKDGWTPQRQQDFIAALADSGCIEHAAMQVHMSVKSCYRLRRSPGAENFAAAWDVALQHASRKLLDVAFDRALRGNDEPVFDRAGNVTGRRYRQNDRLLMFLLRAYHPERFRHAHRDWRAPDEPLPPAPLPMDAALRRLEPVRPAAPHALMPPDELADAVMIADTSPPGQLPHWHRGRGDEEPLSAAELALEAELDMLIHGEARPARSGEPEPFARPRER